MYFINFISVISLQLFLLANIYLLIYTYLLINQLAINKKRFTRQKQQQQIVRNFTFPWKSTMNLLV